MTATSKSPPSAHFTAAGTANEKGDPEVNPKYACFRLRIGRSPIHRWGVYAEEFIPKGRKIMEYTGEKISRRETKIRAEREFNYLFTLDTYWTIDGSVNGSGAEYINHCCEPSVEARIVRRHILYFALRNIEPGEELTVDYRFEAEVERHPCGCGAKQCRGTINLLKEPRRNGKSKPTA